MQIDSQIVKTRRVSKVPFKIIDAPQLLDDFYLKYMVKPLSIAQHKNKNQNNQLLSCARIADLLKTWSHNLLKNTLMTTKLHISNQTNNMRERC